MIIFINLHGCGCKPKIMEIGFDSGLIEQIKEIMKKYRIKEPNRIKYKGKQLINFNDDESDCENNYNIRHKKFHHKNHFYENIDLTLNFDIKEYDIIDVYTGIVGGGIDNIKNEIDLKIGFDINLIKRDELYVNMIHFDSKMTNKENYDYYNNFKVNVVGGFYAIDDLNILKNYLEKIKEKIFLL